MAAILNGFAPLRRKDLATEDRVLNTRWGDTAISAPIHQDWVVGQLTTDVSESSPDLERELPPTPPHHRGEIESIFVVRDDEESNDVAAEEKKASFTVTIPLPWRKKKPIHTRNISATNSEGHSRFGQATRVDRLPQLGTAEAAAIVPLPESRIASPVSRLAASSPVLSFRERLASPSISDILSPVAEGFAKEGPSRRTNTTPLASYMQPLQPVVLDRPPTNNSMRSVRSRAQSLGGDTGEGLMQATMSSQAGDSQQTENLSRPASRGIGSIAYVRPFSRGSRAPSVEPSEHRAASVEPCYQQMALGGTMSQRRGALHGTAEARVDIWPDTVPQSQVTESDLPFRRRAASVEPGRRRSPSVEPRTNRRAMSKEPRSRRAGSVEPQARNLRFHSERLRPNGTHRNMTSSDEQPDAYSSDEAIGKIESFFSSSQHIAQLNRFNEKFPNNQRPTRRRSIASPVVSPVSTSFSVLDAAVAVPSTQSAATLELRSIMASRLVPSRTPDAGYTVANSPALSQSAHVGVARASPAPVGRARAQSPIAGPPSLGSRSRARDRSQSRTRGLYKDMADDYRSLARDVQNGVVVGKPFHSPQQDVLIAPVSLVREGVAQNTSNIISEKPVSAKYEYRADTSTVPSRTTASPAPTIGSLGSYTDGDRVIPQHPVEPRRRFETAGMNTIYPTRTTFRQDLDHTGDRERTRARTMYDLEKQRERDMLIQLGRTHLVRSDGSSASLGADMPMKEMPAGLNRMHSGGIPSHNSTDTKPYDTVTSGDSTLAMRGKSSDDILVPSTEEIWS